MLGRPSSAASPRRWRRGGRGMRSHLLDGKVRHRRARPVTLRARARRLLLRPRPRRARRGRPAGSGSSSRNRRERARFRDADHLPGRSTDLDARRPRAPARRTGLDPDGWRDHPGHEPAGPRLRLQPGQLLPLPRRRRAAARGRSSRSTTRYGERHLYTLQPGDGDDGRVRGRDGQGRSTCRRSSTWTAATRSTSGTTPTGLRIAIAERQGGGAAAQHEPRPAAAAV